VPTRIDRIQNFSITLPHPWTYAPTLVITKHQPTGQRIIRKLHNPIAHISFGLSVRESQGRRIFFAYDWIVGESRLKNGRYHGLCGVICDCKTLKEFIGLI
jgi:hypothetical protein